MYVEFYDVFFVDENNGWVAGLYGDSDNTVGGIVAHTNDRGNTWKIQLKGPKNVNLSNICFVNNSKGWIIGISGLGQGALLHTENGGQNWEWKIDDSFFPVAINFVDSNEGWLIKNRHDSGYGKILHTQDGGETWQVQLDLGMGAVLDSSFFLNHKEGWVVQDYGRIYHTVDGGQNWDKYDSDGEIGCISVYFITSEEGWATGRNSTNYNPKYILHTIDGGKSWTIQSVLENSWLMKMYFADKNEGWIFGRKFVKKIDPVSNTTSELIEGGMILHTDDSGRTWQTQFETEKPLNSMYFLNGKSGWAIGRNILIYTKDGGNTWATLNYPLSTDETGVSPIMKLPVTWGHIKVIRGDNIGK